MERSNSGFYTIDAYSLSKSSGKPFHLAQRFPNYPRLVDAAAEAQLKRDAFLHARREKLSQRFLQAQMVAHNAKEKNELRRVTIEQNLLAAERKRTARLEKLRLSSREMVERAKLRAKQHRLNDMAIQESRRRAIDQKLLKSEKRRMALQRRSKSQLMKQKLVLPHEPLAPMTNLPLPAYKRLQIAIQVFKKFRLKRVEQHDFQELVGKLKDPELITAAGTVLAQGQTKLDKKKARTFLTAFMIVSCPSAILLDIESKQEQSLLQAAKTLLHAFQEWLEAAHTNKFDSKWYAFEDCWNSYYALFEAWKSKDVEKLVDNLITHYIELERLWDTLGKDADNASEIRSQLDEQQLQISQKLLKVGGPQAQQKLDTAKKTIELAREEAQKRSQRERADSVLSVPSSPTPRAEKVHQATTSESSTSRTSSHSDDLARILGSFSPAVGITNEQLAHEVVMNPDFKLEKNGKSELVDQVRDIATKAFFDSMREDFANKNYQRWIPGLVGDMKQRLLSLAPATSKIHQDVNDTLDLALIAQQINAETYNVDNTVQFVIHTMEKLCAPVRDDAVHAISRAGDLANTFRAILELLDQMNLDLANYRIQALRPYLKEISIEYEREKFSTALMNGKIGLVKTRDWLRTASTSLQGIAGQRNPEGIEDVESNIKFTDVYNEALASLLSSSEALLPDSCPETLLLDVERITGYQNEAQAITIVAALLMLTKNFSSAEESSRHRTSTSAMKALRDKLFVLLEAKDTTVENLSLQVIQSIQELSDVNFEELPEDKQKLIRTMVAKTLSYKDTVYSLLSRRLLSIIRSHLQHSQFSSNETLNSYGFGLVRSKLEKLSFKMFILARHNRDVYARWYDEIIGDITRTV
ncbi:hypothetical protein INT44_005693 [Umbelopsis vinacea]|uniref:T-complex protein 11-domain-containing protein n=1 Tax=Umbelopsis vinacea TaxID=44442 RepID=A0A8H7PZN5_9FUNG|nr:hypothetical protein INT44_005693 [Umbelopsis vinacea]